MSDEPEAPKVIAFRTRQPYVGPEGADSLVQTIIDNPEGVEPEHGDVMLLDRVTKLAMDGKTRGIVVIVGSLIDGALRMESFTSPAVDDEIAHFVGGMELQKALLVNAEMELNSQVEYFE